MSEQNGPREAAPAGMKWWSRPSYGMAMVSITGPSKSEWYCAFCPRKYEGGHSDDFRCECGARFVPGDSWMWGLVPESYNQTEVWM